LQDETAMIAQKLEIIRRPENGKNRREGMASCSIRSSAIYDIKRKLKDRLQLFMSSSESA
jgi:hypothetical protein